ncbi:MAG: hypothetical protein UY63_C0004G0046 [Parcubacteria group bacterium GW2011_GWA2_51_10]|nr:MAG: hypothetical protein UY63_C0004G0046 [Parcubacteria group bacterium GW2011_GWA2_51_10]
MKYEEDRRGSKIILILILVVVIYLAFFNFDIRAAFDAAVAADKEFFNLLFGR